MFIVLKIYHAYDWLKIHILIILKIWLLFILISTLNVLVRNKIWITNQKSSHPWTSHFPKLKKEERLTTNYHGPSNLGQSTKHVVTFAPGLCVYDCTVPSEELKKSKMCTYEYSGSVGYLINCGAKLMRKQKVSPTISFKNKPRHRFTYMIWATNQLLMQIILHINEYYILKAYTLSQTQFF